MANRTKHQLSVIVASYNEEKNIAGTIKRIAKAVPEAEILVIDDGSKDATSKMAKGTGLKNLRVIRYTPNRGKGYATQVGIDNAKGDIMAQIDADCQFLPEELPKLVKPITEGKADIVFGSRFIKGSKIGKNSLTKIKRVANFVVSAYTSLLAGVRLTDVNAGFKAWTSKSIKDIDIKCAHFAYEPEIAIMAKKRGYKIVEMPISYVSRSKGTSKVNLLRDGIIIPFYLLKVKLSRK